jgi:hypothetical protein
LGDDGNDDWCISKVKINNGDWSSNWFWVDDTKGCSSSNGHHGDSPCFAEVDLLDMVRKPCGNGVICVAARSCPSEDQVWDYHKSGVDLKLLVNGIPAKFIDRSDLKFRAIRDLITRPHGVVRMRFEAESDPKLQAANVSFELTTTKLDEPWHICELQVDDGEPYNEPLWLASAEKCSKLYGDCTNKVDLNTLALRPRFSSTELAHYLDLTDATVKQSSNGFLPTDGVYRLSQCLHTKLEAGAWIEITLPQRSAVSYVALTFGYQRKLTSFSLSLDGAQCWIGTIKTGDPTTIAATARKAASCVSR